MVNRSLEVKRLAAASSTRFACAELAEIFGGLRDDVSTKFHSNASGVLAAALVVETAQVRIAVDVTKGVEFTTHIDMSKKTMGLASAEKQRTCVRRLRRPVELRVSIMLAEECE
jgi:hypothetical protein